MMDETVPEEGAAMARDESRAYSMVLEWWGLLPDPVRRRELGDFAMEFA